MNDWLKVAALLGAGVCIGFFAGFYAHSDMVPALRKESPTVSEGDVGILPSELRSSIAGQQAKGMKALVTAAEGHVPGHIIYTVPKVLPPGLYEAEFRLRFEPAKNGTLHECIADVVANGDVLDKTTAPTDTPLEESIKVNFSSPAANGSSKFQVRLWCDGKAPVEVYSASLRRQG